MPCLSGGRCDPLAHTWRYTFAWYVPVDCDEHLLSKNILLNQHGVSAMTR